MYYCDFCNRKLNKKIRIHGHTVCSKHMHQLFKYNKVLDTNPRTQNDLNEYRFQENNIVEFDVYNLKNEKINSFIVDAEDLNKIKYKKWRIDTNNRIVTGNCTNKNPRRELSRLLLNINDDTLVVDHINGNTLDNRKENLRICTQQENLCNKSFMSNNTSEFIGVSWDKNRRRWAPEISFEEKRCHLGRYKLKEEAVYARYIAEIKIFKEFRNTNNDIKKQNLFKNISENRKKEIEGYVITKINQKFNLCV